MTEDARPMTILEPARELAVNASYDVAVVGAGIAGVAAAVAAVRQGASVCLLERFCAPGGLATLGNVVVWLPICDGCGRQVIGGLAEELLRLSVADLVHGAGPLQTKGIPACWQEGGDAEERRKARYRATFNPSSYMFALEKLVTDSGIRLLYDTRLCAVRREGERVSHLIVENKSGRFALGCRAVVDASGDADVCFLAGEPTESLDSNVLTGWFYTVIDSTIQLRAWSNKYCPRATNESQAPHFRGDDGDQVTEHVLRTRDIIREKIAGWQAENTDNDVHLLMPPTIPCLRMTRRLRAEFSLGAEHVHQWFPDTVGFTGDWRRAGPVYALPLRALCGVRNRNLLAAGRCMSTDTSAWDVTRAIPACAASGEAAGMAAALAVQRNDGDVRALPVALVQEHLRAANGLLDPALVKPAS